jgi:hypothetical protein
LAGVPLMPVGGVPVSWPRSSGFHFSPVIRGACSFVIPARKTRWIMTEVENLT